MTSVFHKILRAVAGAMEIPDVVFLVLALGFAVFSVGWLICEYFTEHRHMREDLPRLLDALRERGPIRLCSSEKANSTGGRRPRCSS